MAHFAEIKDNIVQRVIVISDDKCNGGQFPNSELSGIEFCKKLFGQNTNWKQTSYNSNFRYNFAGAGYTYDEVNDAFISPKPPFDSWSLNDDFKWEAPVPYPTDGAFYIWDEDTLSWILA